jgi:hypothetical protein
METVHQEAGYRPALTIAAVPAAVLAVAVALLSTGFGASADHTHPVLQVMASMVLTVLGVWVVMAVRPFEREATTLPAGEGAARVDYVLRSQVALLSMGAALNHFAVIREHLEEYWLYGVFFVVVALAQMVWAIWVARRPSRMLLIAGAVGNVLVAGAWVLTRTVGALIGPAAHEKAAVGFGDTVSTVFEVLIAAGTIVLLRRDWTSRPLRPLTATRAATILTMLVVTFIVPALFSTVGNSPFISHVG